MFWLDPGGTARTLTGFWGSEKSQKDISEQLGNGEWDDQVWILDNNNSGFGVEKGYREGGQSGGRKTSEEAIMTFQVQEDESPS